MVGLDSHSDEHLAAWPPLPPERVEASLEDKPLLLLSTCAPADKPWRPVLWDEDRRCFSFYCPSALGPAGCRHFFDRLSASVPWRELKSKAGSRISRYTGWYTRSPACRCQYTYGLDTRVSGSDDAGGVAALHREKDFRDAMEELWTAVFENCFPRLPRDAWPDCANLNWYDNGAQGVGWHADDEMLFQGAERDCPIVSLSLGGAREFWLAAKVEGSGVPDVRQGVVELDLKDGDLLTMEGLSQKYCYHFVPFAHDADATRQQPRINVTFRWLRVHKLQCPLSILARDHAAKQRAADDLACAGAALDVESAGTDVARDAKDDEESRQDQGNVETVSKHFKIVDAESNQRVDAPKQLAEARSRFLAKAAASGSIVLSAVSEVAKPLFGEGPPRSDKAAPLPRPLGKLRRYLEAWPVDDALSKSASSTVKWQACDGCGHQCFANGRACREAVAQRGGGWWCRCCWETPSQQATVPQWSTQSCQGGAYAQPWYSQGGTAMQSIGHANSSLYGVDGYANGGYDSRYYAATGW
eukprot:TRINITY_DN17286_c0_g1_i2.p1 TRINITY_DN17286_c0_g1~~TRINITY_DN17286_c0_g1_i2.p1  ORF type:complete len:528 (-),score=83.70 TRINITY_DN17286_c0_g1_i2:138-1721(-)